MWLFFRTWKWALWSWLGAIAIIGTMWYQVQLDVQINEWFGDFYDLIQTALANPGIDYNELFKHGQAQGASTTHYILANGFNINLALLINYHTDAKNFLVFFSEEDLAKFFARSETDTITEYLEGPDFELTDEWLDLHIMDGPRLFRYLGYT